MQQSASQEGPGVLNEQAIMKAKRRSQTGSKMTGHNCWMSKLSWKQKEEAKLATIIQPGGPWGAEWASYHESKKKKPNWQQDDRPQLSLYVDDQSAKAQEVGKYV